MAYVSVTGGTYGLQSGLQVVGDTIKDGLSSIELQISKM